MSLKKGDPLWPAVPSRITAEDPPLLAQVSGMMEDAQPVQALRTSCIRDRAIAGMARKNNAQRENEHDTRRKRGRRCGTANSPLEQAYLPAAGSGDTGNSYSGSSSSSRHNSRRGNGRKRVGPGWNDTATIVRDKNLDRPMVSIDGNDRLGVFSQRGFRREFAGTRSEPAMLLFQPPWSESSLASRGSSGAGAGGSLSPSSRTTQSSHQRQPRRQHHRQHDFLHSRSPRATGSTTVAPNPSSGATGSSGNGGGSGGNASTAHTPLQSSSFDDPESTPLPGVCYIRYPPTPDLAAVPGPSSSFTSHDNGLNASRKEAVRGNKITRLARYQSGDSSPDSPHNIKGEGRGQGEAGGGEPGGRLGQEGRRSTEFPQDDHEAGKADSSEVESSRAHDAGGENTYGTPSVQLTSKDRPRSEGGHVFPTDSSRVGPGAEFEGKRSNQEDEKNEQEKQQQRGWQPQIGNDCLRVSSKHDYRYKVEELETPPAGERRGQHRAGATRGAERQRTQKTGRAKINKILSMMTKEGHPLVASKEFPTLPGVDEHQRPPFCLAQMHDNMRQNRAALTTPFRQRAARPRPPSLTLEQETKELDDQEGGGRTRARMNTHVEQELTMVVRYFMGFGEKGGRNGLTLQNLEAAFRASRRADAFMAIEKKGKAAFAKCLAMLKAHGLSPQAWLEEILSKRSGDSLTTFDMGESIRAYNRAKPSWVRSHKQWLRGYMISEKDLRWCQRFVDPDGNTDVDAEELSNAVRSTLDGKPRLSWEESRAVALILEFEKFISVNRIRLVDLFETVDKDKGGTIDGDELREFLKLGRAESKKRGGSVDRTRERKEKLKQDERERKKADFFRKAVEAKQRHATARETGVYDLLDSLKKFTKTHGLRLADMIQATGAHPDEGMDPQQLLAFFERATNSSLDLTKASLEKIVNNVDEDGDGLLSLSEIQTALTQHTLDELLLRRLARAVAQHVSRRESTERKKSSRSRRGHPASPAAAGVRAASPSVGSRSRLPGDIASRADGSGVSDGRGGSGWSPSSSTSFAHRQRGVIGRCGGVGDDESSDVTLPTGAADGMGSSLASSSITGGVGWPRASASRGDDDPSPDSEASMPAGLGRASTNAENNYNWILDDDSSIDGISSMDGIELATSAEERRAAYHTAFSVPRTSFKVQAGSNLDSSWLPGFDLRFECRRLEEGQRVGGGSCTWYTN